MKANGVIILLLVMLSLSVPAISYHQSTIDQLTESLAAEIREHRIETVQYEREKAILTRRLQPAPYETPIGEAVMTSGCGYRMDPMGGGTEGLHKGVDLVGKEGSPIKAALSGRVVEHWPAPDGYYTGHPVYGGLVVIETDGLFMLYGHLEDTQVHEGEWVEAGDDIGVMGDNGVSTGPHLHFEVVVDPLKYLEEMKCR
ncbi:MAG: M23 family metallopeptidase [Spirochaetota bacterium]|nr:M23 family metallopeptidase [Spirochaetota bacterium]